tara:strand:- start:4679 stop:7939 length:3261 start_codon:yes stop_codon:yes gene_type:complete
MANDIIDIVVSKKAVDEVYKLDNALQEAYKSFLQFYELSVKAGSVPTAGNATPKARKNLNEMEKAMLSLEATEKKLAIAQSDVNKKLIEKRELLRVSNLKVKQAAQENNKLLGAYANLGAKLARLRREYKDVAASEGVASKNAVRLAKDVVNLDNKMKKIDGSVGQFGRNVGNYSSAFGGLSRNLRQVAGAFGFVGGIYLFANAIRDSFQRVREFDKAMQNIAGVMRSSRGEIADVEREIIAVAGSSVKTSREVAALAESLVTLGKTKNEVKDLLKPVVDLSIGLNASADEAGEFLVQMLNTFGASTDEAAKYADTIATIRTSTTLDFQKMRDSFQYLAPISRALNKDIAYTGSLIGILADNGIKAERAGRLLGTAQQKLAASGMTLDDALEQINQKVASGATEIEVLALASELLGKQSASLGLVLANNAENIEKQAEAIRNNSGALEDLVGQQLESLDAKLKILDSTWEKFILSISNGEGALGNFFKNAIDFATDFLGMLEQFNETPEDKRANAENKGLKSGKQFIDITQKSGMSDENKQIAIDEYRLEKQKEFNDVYSKRRKLANDVAIAERKLGETGNSAGLLGGDSLEQTKFKKSVEDSNTALSDNAIKLNEIRAELVAISEFQLRGTETEAGVTEAEAIKLTEKQGKKAAKENDQRLKDSFALKKYLLEQEIELNDEIAEDEKVQYFDRVQALNNFQDKSEDLLELERDQNLIGLQKNSDASKLVWAKYHDDVSKLHKEFYGRLDEISVIEDPQSNDVIESPSLDDTMNSFASFFGFDPEDMLKLWEEYVARMEKIGKDATLNDFFDELTVSSKEAGEQLKDVAKEIAGELVNTTNAVFDNRIQRIDDDVNRTNDYYTNILDNEQLTEQQRSALEAERDAKVAVLEKKKRDEQRKQAIFNKTVALAEIAINTAIAVSKVAAQTGVLSPLLIPAIIALGAVQAATVLATPIPQYKQGKKKGDNYEGMALLNDGGRDEVRLKSDGTAERIKGRNVVDFVGKDDIIYPSVSAFNSEMGQVLNDNAISSSRVVNVNNKGFDLTMLNGIKTEISSGIKQGFKSAKITNVQNFKGNDLDSYIRSKMH